MESGIEEITLAELLTMAMDSRQTDLHVSMPAQVSAYHAVSQTVDVVPMLRRALPDGAGNYTTESLPKLSNVPVCFPRVGGMFISLPIAAGDYVWLIFGERNIGGWRSTGNVSDIGDLGMHTLDGAMAIPGVFPDNKALSNADGTNMVIGSDASGPSRIEIKPSGGMNLGAGATKGVARQQDSVDAGTLSGTAPPGGGPVTFTYVPSGGGPPVVGVTALLTGGKITSASGSVKAVD